MLDDAKQGAVRVALDHLTRMLRASTKKRPLHPPKLTAQPDEKTQTQKMLSELVAKMLVQRGLAGMSDYDLHTFVFKVVQDTELEGTVCHPGNRPPPRQESYDSYGYRQNPQSGTGKTPLMISAQNFSLCFMRRLLARPFPRLHPP